VDHVPAEVCGSGTTRVRSATTTAGGATGWSTPPSPATCGPSPRGTARPATRTTAARACPARRPGRVRGPHPYL